MNITTPSDQHNQFVLQTVKEVGQKMFTNSTFEQQLVMLESLIAGLFGTAIILAHKEHQSNEYLSTLTHGVRGRLVPILDKLAHHPTNAGSTGAK